MVVRPLAIMALLLLAGCSEAPADDAGTLQVKEVQAPQTGLGSISGVVVTETIHPIPGAEVTLVGRGLATVTNEAGQFSFEDIEPGTYFLAASAFGFASTQSSVDVLADKVAKPKILLPAVEVKDPYHVTVQRNTFNVLSVPVVIVYYTGETIEIDGPFVNLTVDGTWRGDVLIALDPDRVISTVVSTDTDGFSQSFLSPVQYSRTFSGENTKQDAAELRWNSKPGFESVSFQAQGELFFTTWYHAPAPEGWSVLKGDT